MFGCQVEVVERNEVQQFKILPKRWIDERRVYFRRVWTDA